jgi:pimeloyl-ACP methyl ester carboxylesterase
MRIMWWYRTQKDEFMPKGGPTSHIYFSERLRLHYVDWGNPTAPPMLMIHGGRDHCRNWDWVAEAFREEYHIIAPDLRGHGDSQWMIGGSYNTLDYVYDIAQLLHQTRLTPVTILAHSMGGSIALLYAGIYPENVKKLVSIEGLGPSPQMLERRQQENVGQRLRGWIDGMRRSAGRTPRRYASLEDAFQRMRDENPHLSEAQARHLTIHGSNQNEDGTYSWKFDNYVRANAPLHLPYAEVEQLHSNITCPTLLMVGAESWASDPAADGRAARFHNARVVRVPNAGHWVHHDQLDVFLTEVRGFLAE